MGWTYTTKPRSITATEFLIKHSGALTWSGESEYEHKVLDSGIVKMRTFYAAIEMVHKTTGERTVWAAVFLLNYAPKSYHNFGWKDMDETMGPCEAQCPERILKLLTPTDNENANDWRTRCWNRINRIKALPKIVVGCDIVLHGKKYQVAASRGRSGYIIHGEGGSRYRLSLMQAREVTEVILKDQQCES